MSHQLPSPASLSRALSLSDRVYRGLLAAYPAEFRRRYGPEMAQVFRTCCRASYRSSGAAGVLRLWLPTLWDWIWSAAGERFSGLFRRSQVYHIHTGRAGCQLIPILFFLNVCLICLIVNPCTWLFGDGDNFLAESCGAEVDNQSGTTLRVTPINTDTPFLPVRLYRRNFPNFPAYQQSHISVETGERAVFSFNCEHSVSEVYACDLDGECYIEKRSQYENWGYRVYTFKSLDSLSRPEAALQAAVQSFPEHNYSYARNVLLCSIQIIALIAGVYWLVRSRVVEMPKGDI